MVSGSSVANTVTTGSVTIPLMKKTGYRGEFAGAVEAAASTGGQIMPPIMGAAAFLMAEMVGVQYGVIAVKAILPAFLYFLGIFIMVHLEAKRLGLKGLSKEELPKFGHLILTKGFLLLPLIILVVMVMKGFTMSRSAVIATFVAIAVSMIRKETRMNFDGFVTALENGAKNTLSVAIACGIAGIIAGVVTMTGLGQILISAIVSVAGNVTLIALLLTMVTCVVLGMGVPTTANYIIMATTCAPILVTGMHIEPIAAHMFVFYFGIVADITPPVALAAYAGSAIAKSNPMRTALNASKLAIAAFIVPYIFALNPAMLFIDTTAAGVVMIVVTSIVGLFGVSAGLEGFMMADMPMWQRILSVIGGLMLIYPGNLTDILGVAIVGVVLAMQVSARRKAAA
jgi:TRAP transporter 4TM/12TM fusion protein